MLDWQLCQICYPLEIKLLLLLLLLLTDVVQTLSWLFGSHDQSLTRQRIFTVNRYIKLNNYEEAKTRTRQIQCAA